MTLWVEWLLYAAAYDYVQRDRWNRWRDVALHTEALTIIREASKL